MLKTWWSALALTFVALSQSGAMAQQEPDQAEIVVTAPRELQEELRAFVGAISMAPPTENQLARWDREVCVGIIGIQARFGQFMADRISARAEAVGLRPGHTGCRANVVVFVTPDSDLLARTIVSEFRELVGANQRDNQATQGSEALDAFIASPRPVRWWHVANTVSADGHVLGDVPASQNSRGEFEAQTIRTTSLGFGRLSRTTRQDFGNVVIIVDASRAAGMQFDALSDYVAMVALSQVDPDADTTGTPTILNLFSEATGPRPAALTDWDIAYLAGLYDAPRNARNANQQESAIARSMSDTLTTPAQ